jgi:hypothetical protein
MKLFSKKYAGGEAPTLAIRTVTILCLGRGKIAYL